MRRFNNDLFKRSEAARLASKRADARLAKRFNDVGGIDDEMRYHMAQIKREQAMLKRELRSLKMLEHAKTAKEMETKQRGGVIHLAEPKLDQSEDSVLKKHQQNLTHIDNGYGRNYFGYHSSPGSNKSHNKTAKELEKSIDLYFNPRDDVDPVAEGRRKKKLKQQRQQNKQIQDKVDSWSVRNTSKRKFSVTLPPNLIHMRYLKDEFAEKNGDVERLPDLTPRNNDDDVKAAEVTQGETDENVFVEKVDVVGPMANGAQHPNTQNPMEFNADFYAPDGRVRMIHRLPDPKRAYEEARKARYVRTKYKRDFERQLSVSQIFKD